MYFYIHVGKDLVILYTCVSILAGGKKGHYHKLWDNAQMIYEWRFTSFCTYCLVVKQWPICRWLYSVANVMICLPCCSTETYTISTERPVAGIPRTWLPFMLPAHETTGRCIICSKIFKFRWIWYNSYKMPFRYFRKIAKYFIRHCFSVVLLK